MGPTKDIELVVAFNEAINRRDLEALTSMMHEEHEFIDPAGAVVRGREACVLVWRELFTAFPDYHNVIDELRGDASGGVVAVGRSVCSLPDLDGPATWRAVVADEWVLRWQVSDRVKEDPR